MSPENKNEKTSTFNQGNYAFIFLFDFRLTVTHPKNDIFF